MTRISLERILACPECKTKLTPRKKKGNCSQCGYSYKKQGGIWYFTNIKDAPTKASMQQYERIHRGRFFGPTDGSYEILSSFARGNRTVDIACGEGTIERQAPNTVGVEFSLNALKKARKAGVRHLVLADAHGLPFTDNAFDLAICAGSLEHFQNPQQAINEMVRVSTIQILTVHRELPFPLSLAAKGLSSLMQIPQQPIERPIKEGRLQTLLKNAGLHVVFKGIWTLPLNYGRPIHFLPEFSGIGSSHFVISIKK